MDKFPRIFGWMGNELKKAQASANRFEAVVIFLLLAVALWPALTFKLAVLVPLLHGLFLFCTFLLLSHYLARVKPLLGHIFFAVCVTILAIEIAIHHYTSLHLNRFVLSLAFQPQAADQIGLSDDLMYQLGGVLLLAYLGARFLPWKTRLPLRILLVTTGGLLLATQVLYALLLFQRDTALLNSQRHFVFFTGLHHYYAERLFTPIFGPRPSNPFSSPYNGTAQQRRLDTEWAVTRPLNLLLVVVDSTRSLDIKADPSIAPNLMRLGQRGFLSLDHLSVANCTHFGMHTLLSGTLATRFGDARHSGQSEGIFAALSGAGYRISSAEAQSLDWYDLAAIFLPQADRQVAVGDNKGARDQFVADQTVERLKAAGTAPWAHLAYFSGPHFPYDRAENLNIQAYQTAIRQTDRRIGDMLDALASSGALKDTLVIITSDHGEEVSENNKIGHGSALNDAQTRVPLLVLGATLPTGWIRSHRDILPLVRAEMGAGPLRALPNKTEVLTGCDYEFPKSFALIDADGRVDFRLEDGLLAPMRSPDGSKPDEDQVRRASLALIKLLQEKE